jgi:gamma-glutamylcyclotransferase (GGCT)/AIG2-like uncharacterized protein YtfP
MELDAIIDRLNKRQDIADVWTARRGDDDLDSNEKELISNYQPLKHLIVYGSLAPGKSNHFIVENIKGIWRKAIVRGKLYEAGWGAGIGYPGFSHVTAELQKTIEAHIFSSEELVDHWSRIDEFEGEDYRRLLAKYQLLTGEIGVGYIYAINPTQG